jgi:imidazolonepropionase-like amidohydrolase
LRALRLTITPGILNMNLMKKALATLLLLLMGLITGRAQNPAPQATTLQQGMTLHQVAFIDVNIIDVEMGRLRRNQTVYVEDGVIKTIRKAQTARLPKGTLRINGRDKYLIPGLADMHIHHTSSGAFADGAQPPLYDEKDLLLYLVNGLTTVRNMAGTAFDLTIKSKLSKGEIIGPHYYTSGPALVTGKRGFTVSSPEQAAAVIAEQKKAGFDFIKVYCCFTKENQEIYDRILEAAQAQQIPAVGHIQIRLPFEDALKLRSIEHLEHLPRYFHDEFPDLKKHQELVKKLLESKTVICPTLTPFELYKLSDEKALAKYLKKPEMRYFSALQFDEEMNLLQAKKSYLNDPAQGKDMKQMYDAAMRYVYFLHQQKIPLILGTDSGGIFPLAPGFSVHRELELLTRAGLSPMEALRTATVNVARFLGNADKRGSIAEGKDADLVLLDQNPLVNISNTRTIRGVMIGKTWIDSPAIANILLKLKKR